MDKVTRRNVLRGIGGAMLPIPLLTSLRAHAAQAPDPHPLVIVRQGNGVAQATGGIDTPEPERFWPSRVGPLLPGVLAADTGRSTSVLAPWASRLLMVKGTNYGFEAKAERHAAGGNQLLTAREPGEPTMTIMTYAMGESVDNFVARMQPQVNGGEPLTLFTGGRAGMGEEVLSYRGKDDLRAAEDDPWSVYRRLLGGTGTMDQRRSINDFVLEELNGLLHTSELSTDDRQRLERHVDSVRDFEALCARLSAEQESAMQSLSGLSRLDDYRVQVAQMHCDLIALALDCDLARAVTLQIGDRTDLTCYTVNGTKLRQFHSISHREQGEGDALLHQSIDQLLLTQVYSYLLSRLDERGLLDRSVVAYMSELGDGVTHSFTDIPWIIAGVGDGTLRTGVYAVSADKTHNKVLNTLITATGIRDYNGEAYTTFGDQTLEPGLLDCMVSPTAPI